MDLAFTEKIVLTVFLILFFSRVIWRYALERVNIKHLQKYGRKIPAGFEEAIDKDTLNKMVNYTIDNSRLGSKEEITDDIITLVILFLLLPVIVGAIAGQDMHLICQALIFFLFFTTLGAVVGIPFDLYSNFVLEKKYGFPQLPGVSGSAI